MLEKLRRQNMAYRVIVAALLGTLFSALAMNSLHQLVNRWYVDVALLWVIFVVSFIVMTAIAGEIHWPFTRKERS